MANSEKASKSIELATKGDLQDAIVVGKDINGKVAFYMVDVDKEKMIALLERARTKLVNSMDV